MGKNNCKISNNSITRICQSIYIYTRRDSVKINEPCMFMPATLILHHWNLNAFLPGIQGHIVVVQFNIIMNYTDQISDDDTVIRNVRLQHLLFKFID